MNYVGSISILDRGDAPAQAVIDRNARSLAQRVADETKEELAKVLSRVDHIYGNFELSQSLLENSKTSLECVQDLGELESLINDQVKKKKYQQQVTVFIVGFENVCGQKLRLLQQVNEFFVENATLLEDDDMLLQSPDLDLEEMEDAVEETLRQTENLGQKLLDLKNGLDDHMHNLSQMKGSNKAKKTRELEKDLSAAKKQLDQLNTSLKELAKELKEKSDKIDQLQHDIEKRNVDVMRYKKMAEEAKKAGDSDAIKVDTAEKDELIRELKLEIEHLRSEMGQHQVEKDNDLKILVADSDKDKERIRQLEFALDGQTIETEEDRQADPEKGSSINASLANAEIIRLHQEEVEELKQQHETLTTNIKQQHAEEIRSLLHASVPKELPTEPGDRSRPVTKEASRLSRQNKSRGSSKPLSKQSSGASIVVEDIGDGDKQPTRSTLKTRSSLEPVKEIHELEDDGYELKDEPSWSAVPAPHVSARFLQYRQLTNKKLDELEAQIDHTVQKTTRKVNTLKAQFQEHKSKWEKERDVLMNHIEQAEELQNDAEKEADIAINQLEEIINDQEGLEAENEDKRVALEKGEREPTLTVEQAEENLKDTLEEQAQAQAQAKAQAQETPEEGLLAQTDDAKAELSRRGTKVDSDITTDELTVAQSPDKLLQREGTLSRGSMRSHASIYDRRQVLSSLKASAEERRAKSPTVYSIKTQKSVLNDAELDENGDMPFPKDETKEERARRISMHDAATSPIFREKTVVSDMSKSGIPMHDHPVVTEYLKTYNSILVFKDNLSQAFLDKDMTSLSQVISEVELVDFMKDSKVQPQIEEMGKCVQNILDEAMVLLRQILSTEREYPVSSLVGLPSKEPSSVSFLPGDTVASMKTTPTVHSAVSKASSTKGHLQDLQERYLDMQHRFDDEKMKHEAQLNHNMVVMMEMQDTINGLKREMSTVNKQQQQIQEQPQNPADASIMFSRLDSERNAKIMKRAVNERRLEPGKYEDALEKMGDYTSLPGKRLNHLVNKYVHHVQMKEVEENIKKSKALDDDVYGVLDKMETLQNERARRWADHMDGLGDERLRLMSQLMETLDDIEKESGIFLIKPMYSYKANPGLEKTVSKMSRAHRLPSRGGAHGDLSTPSSKNRPVKTPTDGQSLGPEDGIYGQASNLLGDYPRPIWNQQQSTSSLDPMTRYMAPLPGQINTPRILELDINRMLIGQNQVSLRIPQGFVSNDRLANAANTSIRSYVTVNRPAGHPTPPHKDRPRSHTGISEAPPATPMAYGTTPQNGESPYSPNNNNPARPGSGQSQSTTGSRQDSPVTRAAFTSTPPLPPIAADARDYGEDESPQPSEGSPDPDRPYPPVSPPGSSMRQTPAYILHGSQTPAHA